MNLMNVDLCLVFLMALPWRLQSMVASTSGVHWNLFPRRVLNGGPLFAITSSRLSWLVTVLSGKNNRQPVWGRSGAFLC